MKDTRKGQREVACWALLMQRLMLPELTHTSDSAGLLNKSITYAMATPEHMMWVLEKIQITWTTNNGQFYDFLFYSSLECNMLYFHIFSFQSLKIHAIEF